jgi:hypothetical protein
MAKLDLKKQFRALFAASSRDFSEVDVPTVAFVKVDGAGRTYVHCDGPSLSTYHNVFPLCESIGLGDCPKGQPVSRRR